MYIMSEFITKDIQAKLDRYDKMMSINKKKSKKYQQSENGKKRCQIASQKYYYKKNNKYHKEYNPDGCKIIEPEDKTNKVKCLCGTWILKVSLKRHMKSKKHLNLMNQ